MSAFAVVTGRNWDGSLATPTAATASVNYSPSSIDAAGVATWFTNPTNVLDDRKKLSMSVRQPSKGSQVARVQVKLVHPLMDASDNTLKIGECLANLEFVFPKVATLTQRNLLMGHVLYFAYESDEMASAVNTLEAIY